MPYDERIDNLPPKMKAVVAYKPRDYRMEEIPPPEIGDEEILLKVGGVEYAPVMLKAIMGSFFWGNEGQPAWIQAPYPTRVLWSGVALGKGAKEKYGLSLGDWAVSEQIVLWKCRFCLDGKY